MVTFRGSSERPMLAYGVEIARDSERTPAMVADVVRSMAPGLQAEQAACTGAPAGSAKATVM